MTFFSSVWSTCSLAISEQVCNGATKTLGLGIQDVCPAGWPTCPFPGIFPGGSLSLRQASLFSEGTGSSHRTSLLIEIERHA